MVVERGPTHPSDLTQRFGRVSAGNDWGGRSAATTTALEELHFYGLLRVLHRDNGTKVYEPAADEPQHHSARERVRLVALLIGRHRDRLGAGDPGYPWLVVPGRVFGGRPSRRSVRLELMAYLVLAGQYGRAAARVLMTEGV
jgi:hypothetical protein